MSTYTSEPGTQLAGRYRLVDQTSEGAGWTYWKATDETLARSVTVLTFAAGFPRVAEVVTAARAASRLSDPRFSKVFDVEDADEHAYVVTEWVVGESLLDMLADGPLDSPHAVMLVSEAARALAAAHADGLAHLRLGPACLHWTAGGGVKITGLAVDAALAGAAPAASQDGDNPELIDTRDLARLLYAALTGYWPGPLTAAEATRPPGDQEPGGALEAAETQDLSETEETAVVTAAAEADGAAEAEAPTGAGKVEGGDGAVEPGGLPPAPEADGVPCTPRQVSAAVPANIDALTCQALFQRPSRHGPALSTPAMFAEALASVAKPEPLPVTLMPAAAARAPDGHEPHGSGHPYRPAVPVPRAGAGASYRRTSGERSPAATAIVSAVIVLVLAAAGIAGWTFSHQPHTAAPPPTGSPSSSSGPSAASATVLRPVSANSFDAYGDDDGNEDGSAAQYVIESKPGQFWHTDYYLNHPVFGNLKTGTGLILDMGRPVRLSQVMVRFGTSCCAHVEIEIGNDDSPVPSALAAFTEVSSSDHAAGPTTFDVTSHATGRYVLIWITYLPPMAGYTDRFQAQVYGVVVHGFAASQSG
jgi:hypothetical protein